jgi:hypothetical protein
MNIKEIKPKHMKKCDLLKKKKELEDILQNEKE